MKLSVTAVSILLLACAAALGQANGQLGSSGQIGQRQQATAARPAPRLPDGRISLGPYPGEIGMWLPFNGGSERLVNPDNITAEAAVQFAGRPKSFWN